MEFSTVTLALVAIVSVLGLVGVVAVDTISVLQDVQAKVAVKGCLPSSTGSNASLGRCIKG
jgi:hypothetical protein